MRVSLELKNPALLSLMNNPEQIITLDANFLIPPHRRYIKTPEIGFSKFKGLWLDPIFSAFPNLAIHEAVLEELILPSVRSYVEEKINSEPPGLRIHRDSDLTPAEAVLRNTIESRIYPLTRYDPSLDNRDDRGEVKSLAFIAAKGLIYFAAHDSNAIQLIEKSEEWSTGLDNVRAIHMYELIFYLHREELGDKEGLRMLYRYQYYLTAKERNSNPNWGEFVDGMDKLYSSR